MASWGDDTESEWDLDIRSHRELLRIALEEHRDGLDWEEESLDGDNNLVLEEEILYPPVQALFRKFPPKAVQGESGWIYHSKTFFLLRPAHLPRFFAILIIESSFFDPFILLTIMCNCATMAWASPLDPPGTPKEALLAVLEWVYLIIFTFELVMKILAYGFVGHKHSYLRDAWCQLDFVVVSLAWMPILFPNMGDVSAIRSVRALRPLRALKRVPGMPVLVGSILKSLPALGNVAGLMAFVFLVFGIVGFNLFKGVRHATLMPHSRYATPTAAHPRHTYPTHARPRHTHAHWPRALPHMARGLSHTTSVRLMHRVCQILRYRCADPAVLELESSRQLGALEPNSSTLFSAPLTSQHLFDVATPVAASVGEHTAWEVARAVVSRALKGGGSNREDRGGGEGEVG